MLNHMSLSCFMNIYHKFTEIHLYNANTVLYLYYMCSNANVYICN